MEPLNNHMSSSVVSLNSLKNFSLKIQNFNLCYCLQENRFFIEPDVKMWALVYKYLQTGLAESMLHAVLHLFCSKQM